MTFDEYMRQAVIALGIILGWYIFIRMTVSAVLNSYLDFRIKLQTKIGKGEGSDGKK